MTKRHTRKGINTFKGFQDEKQRRREKLIRDYLTALKNTRATFKFKTDLAKHVAAYVASEENGKCAPGTLLRNVRYEPLLQKYMTGSRASGCGSLSAGLATESETNALLMEQTLTISNLRRELERLSTYCGKLETKLGEKNVGGACLDQEDVIIDDTSSGTDYKYQFVKTCQALRLVLDYIPNQFEIEPTEGFLKDKVIKRGNNVVVQAENMRPYNEWKKNCPM